ncbi:MAG: ATP-binding cassette domain-containing protein [Candidatus Dojkabacteria bacterium]
MIELKNVKKSYGANIAVNDISLKINKGEIVGLLGPNGAGKSTTMKMLCGYLVPEDGIIEIDSKNLKENMQSSKQKIGYMPENNPLYKDMRVGDAIDFAMDLKDIPIEKRKEMMDRVIKATGLQDVFFKQISELSKGYKQRVGIAQVLAGDPDILVLDEPTEGLDPNQRSEIRTLIKELGKDKTVIISTHVMQEVEAMCTRIILINKGRVIADGDKDSIIKGKNKDALIKLRIKSNSDPKPEVSKIEGVKNINTIKVEGDIRNMEVTVKDANKFFEEFNTKLKTSSWVIFEIQQKQENLEEVFRELTMDSAPIKN